MDSNRKAPSHAELLDRLGEEEEGAQPGQPSAEGFLLRHGL